MTQLEPFKPKANDIIEYVLSKIESGIESEEEYDFFCEYKYSGWKVAYEMYRELVHELAIEVREEWGRGQSDL